jgi:hypothetical protein
MQPCRSIRNERLALREATQVGKAASIVANVAIAPANNDEWNQRASSGFPHVAPEAPAMNSVVYGRTLVGEIR